MYTILDARFGYIISLTAVFLLDLFFANRKNLGTAIALAIFFVVSGVVAAIFPGYIYAALDPRLKLSLVEYSYTVAPIVEESLKFAALIISAKILYGPLRIPRLLSSVQGGVLVGAGLTFLERNMKLAYAFGIFENAPVHSVATEMLGFSIVGTNVPKKRRLVALFVLAIVAHGSFNYLSASAKTFLQIELLFVLYWLLLVLILIFDNVRTNRGFSLKRHNELISAP